MRANAKDIAERITGLRRDRGLSATELAAYVRVTPEQYDAYESAAVDIPAPVLTGLATRFGVDVGALMTGTTFTGSPFAVTRGGTGPAVARREGFTYESLAAGFKGAKVEPYLVTLPMSSSDAPIPQNTHPGQEFHYLLQGRVQVKVRDQHVYLDEGDSLIFDATTPHGLKAVDNEAKLLAVLIIV